jgi:diguanylate cyclase (GGDEF)-like protein
MSLKVFHIAILAVLASVAALSVAWEFWLEDRLMPSLVSHYEAESLGQRWEFVVTTVLFAALAMIGPLLIGGRVIRREQALHEKVIRLSQEDHLTGLLNRRRITELLEAELQRALRYRTALSLVLMDIDHFKAVNDRLGHQAGDRVLTRIAEIVRSRVRASDLVGRWGGEEFIILSPQTDIGGSVSLAEDIRVRLASADLGEAGTKTASFGVTTFAAGDDIETMIARADAALYAAKQGGRNRTETSPAPATA